MYEDTLNTRKEPLEPCVKKDGYVSLNFNSQGFPTSKDSEQKYKQGRNIHFWYPRKGSVARFVANPDGADFLCGSNPDYSNFSLGVFVCAEGTQMKK